MIKEKNNRSHDINISDCATGYEGMMCNTCSAGYYNDGGDANAPNCVGQYFSILNDALKAMNVF